MGRERRRGEPSTIQMGARVAAEREAAGVSRERLAKAVGLDTSMICRIENGDVALTAVRAKEIADHLQIAIGRLYGEGPAAAG